MLGHEWSGRDRRRSSGLSNASNVFGNEWKRRRGCSRGLSCAGNVLGSEWRGRVIDMVDQEDCQEVELFLDVQSSSCSFWCIHGVSLLLFQRVRFKLVFFSWPTDSFIRVGTKGNGSRGLSWELVKILCWVWSWS